MSEPVCRVVLAQQQRLSLICVVSTACAATHACSAEPRAQPHRLHGQVRNSQLCVDTYVARLIRMEASRLVDIAPMMLLVAVSLGRGVWHDFHRSFPDASTRKLVGLTGLAFAGLWLPLLAIAMAAQ